MLLQNDQPTVDEIREAMREACGASSVPALPPPSAVSFAAREHRTIVRIGDWVAHIPHDDVGVRRLARERRVLEALAGNVAFAIPRALGQAPFRGVEIDVRTWVVGETSPALNARAHASPERSAELGTFMGRALAAMHAVPAPPELEAPAWPRPAAALRLGIDAHVSRFEADALRHAQRFVETWEERTPRAYTHLCHGDFGGHNFAFDARSGRPVGVFDFDDACVAETARDFAHIPAYGEHVWRAVDAAYAAAGGKTPERADVLAVNAAMALSYLAWRADDAAAHDAASGRDAAGALHWVTQSVARARAARA